MKQPLGIALMLVLFGGAIAHSQEPQNPYDRRAWSAIDEGKVLYGVFCMRCHGSNAKGGEGPNLTDDVWLHGGSDAEVFRTVTEGVVSNGMQRFLGVLTEDEVWKTISYVRSVARGKDALVTSDETPSGGREAIVLDRNVQGEEPLPYDPVWSAQTGGYPEQGRKIFYSMLGPGNCGMCHKVNGEGGDVGPDLTTIGQQRKPEEIMKSIMDPHADIAEEYRTRMIATKDGVYVTGTVKREDEQTLDIVDANATLFTIEKSRIERMSELELSLMPGNFTEILSVQEFADLIAFIRTLK